MRASIGLGDIGSLPRGLRRMLIAFVAIVVAVTVAGLIFGSSDSKAPATYPMVSPRADSPFGAALQEDAFAPTV